MFCFSSFVFFFFRLFVLFCFVAQLIDYCIRVHDKIINCVPYILWSTISGKHHFPTYTQSWHVKIVVRWTNVYASWGYIRFCSACHTVIDDIKILNLLNENSSYLNFIALYRKLKKKEKFTSDQLLWNRHKSISFWMKIWCFSNQSVTTWNFFASVFWINSYSNSLLYTNFWLIVSKLIHCNGQLS